MLKKLLVLTLLITLGACTKQEDYTFSISGKISPVKDNDIILLEQKIDLERRITKIVDTIIVKDGKFKANYILEPQLYTLILPNKQKIELAIAKDQNIIINVANYDTDAVDVTINGSKDTEELLAYEAFRKASLNRLVNSVRKEIKTVRTTENPDKEKLAALSKLELTNYDKHLDELVDYVKNNMTGIGLYATSIRWKGAHNFSTFDSITSTFKAKYPSSVVYNKLKTKVDRLKQTAIGGTAKEISMPTVEGNLLALSSVNAKYTLIDFWASWCAPCRRESPVLNTLFSKYNRDEFDIYGVSLDANKERWVKALAQDQRNWHNVSTLERFKTPAAYDYAVTALPDNFLIDQSGKILAKNIHGEDLGKLMSELLGK